MPVRKALKIILSPLFAWMPRPQHPSLAYPGIHLRWRLGWVKGWLWRPYWHIRGHLVGPQVSFGKRLSVLGRLKMRGPGRVEFGDDVMIDDCCTPYTDRPDALIRIHSQVFLNGTQFGCADRIEVQSLCILADCRIMDHDYHPLDSSRNLPGRSVPTAPVHFEENVWVAGGAVVLKGVRIGSNSVIAFGSVVTKDVPTDRIYGGNPAKDLGPLPSQSVQP